jgi:hypothetical protein
MILLETLGQILGIHQRLEIAIRSTTEDRTQKRAVDTEESLYPIKRRRHSKIPLAEIAAPNLNPGA